MDGSYAVGWYGVENDAGFLTHRGVAPTPADMMNSWWHGFRPGWKTQKGL